VAKFQRSLCGSAEECKKINRKTACSRVHSPARAKKSFNLQLKLYQKIFSPYGTENTRSVLGAFQLQNEVEVEI
jgi:hypothetical protein